MRLSCPLLVAPLGVALTLSAPARAADPAAGERLFRTQCASCHSVASGRNMVGPSLFGVAGRDAGTVPGYRYSAANRSAGITWTPDVLDHYLTRPAAVIPGTTMSYPGLRNEAQRADLIAYLATLK